MADVLKEYLIALGFKLDEDSWKKFDDAVGRSARDVTALGVSAAGAAVSVGIAVAKIAQGYEDLYYMAQRTGTSGVASLKAYEVAGKSIGLTYEQSRGQIEAFAASVRMNPGLSSLLKGMGIDPNDTVAASTAFTRTLKERFGPQGYFVAARMAEMFGVDERTFKHLWENLDQLEKKQADYAKRLRESGIDTKKLASDSRDFINVTDDLLGSMKLITDQTAAAWLPTMNKVIKGFDDWVRLAIDVGKSTDGISSSIISLIAALGGMKAVGWILSLLGFKTLGGALAGGGGALLAGVGTTVATGAGLGLVLDKDFRDSSRTFLRKTLGIKADEKAERRDEAIKFFMDQGWTREQAVGIAANIERESAWDHKAVGDGGKAFGLFQHHPDRQAKFKEITGKDFKDATFKEQLAFADWELRNTERAAGRALRQARTAGEAGAIVSSQFERPRDVMGEASRRAALADEIFRTSPVGGQAGAGSQVTVNSKTEIKVEGAGDARATADRVVDQQGRVTGDLVRNLRGAIQ